MAKQRIDAIIIQKIATESEWNNIGRVPEKGEFMLIQNSASQPVNLKIGDGNRAFSALPNFIQYDQAAYVAPVGNTLPVPQNGVGYSILTEGTYNSGSIVIPENTISIVAYSGDSWSVNNSVSISATSDFITPDGTGVPSEKAVYDLAVSPLVKGDLASSRYDLTIDEKGWVQDFKDKRTGIKSIEYPISYYAANLKTDEKGFIQQGIDYKGDNIRVNTIIRNDDRIIYSITTDEKGWILAIEKLVTKYQYEESVLVAPAFSSETTVVPPETKHIGFPGACYSLNGVLHVFYRESLVGHAGTDGTIKYTYSVNQGETWSVPVVVLQGGIPKGNGYFLDWRDSKVIRVGNKLFLSAWSNYAKYDPQIDEYPVYDNDVHNYIVSFDINTDGTANIESANRVLVPRVNGIAIAGSGGLYEYANVIYCTGYSAETTNRAFLFKSENMGASFELVSMITSDGNENAICFMEKSLYCLQRLNNSKAAAKLFRSDDKGLNWVEAGQLEGDINNRWIHGHSMKNLGTYMMAVGRGGVGDHTMVRFIDETGRSIIPNIIFGGLVGDSAYSQIAQWQKIVSIVYYKQFTLTDWGIVMRKVNVNNISNLY